MTAAIQLVAHRGEPDSFPENSLQGFAQALSSGAVYLETDVQLTADQVVVLSHDENLQKLTGRDISVTKSTYASFEDLPAGFPQKFSGRFEYCRIATLQQFSDLLQRWPGVTCFIEIKQDSLACLGNSAVDRVMAASEAIKHQAVLISFDYAALVYARNKYPMPIGWVLPGWSSENKIRAEQLAPDYLFVDADFCPQNKAEIWPGSWQWVVYTVDDVAAVKKYAALAINMIETNRFSELQRALQV